MSQSRLVSWRIDMIEDVLPSICAPAVLSVVMRSLFSKTWFFTQFANSPATDDWITMRNYCLIAWCVYLKKMQHWYLWNEVWLVLNYTWYHSDGKTRRMSTMKSSGSSITDLADWSKQLNTWALIHILRCSGANKTVLPDNDFTHALLRMSVRLVCERKDDDHTFKTWRGLFID